MNDKVLICPYFGDVPVWWTEYASQFPILAKSGYDIRIDFDLEGFKERVRRVLGIECPITYGSSKIHDYRAVLGALYADELEGYEWYGHTDFDCVYGRLDHFVTPGQLERCAIYTDCQYDYLAGPFTLYRNVDEVNELYLKHPEWKDILISERSSAWVEKDFAEIAKDNVPVVIDNNHGFSRPELLERRDDGSLFRGGDEISFYHFNRTKEWPESIPVYGQEEV